MNTNPKFKRGDVVHADGTYVLVTGKGDTRAFESFAGVCIATANKNHKVGEYSPTWNRILFEDASIDMSEFVAKMIPPVPPE